MEKQKIKRGDVFFAFLNSGGANVQSGTRPVVVIQNNVANNHSPTVIIAPITLAEKPGYIPTHMTLTDFRGLESGSTVLLEQIRTINKGNLVRFIGWLGRKRLKELDRLLALSVGLEGW